MPPRLMITARPVVLLEDHARALGIDFPGFAAEVGIDVSQLYGRDAEVSCAAFADLLERFARLTNDEQFALGYVEAMPARPAGVYQTIVHHSETLRDAFRAMSRFLALITDALTITYSENETSGSLTFEFASPDVARPQFITGQLGLIAVRARQLLGPFCRPQRVQFSFDMPRAVDKYMTTFGALPEFSSELNRISYALEHVRQPLPSADPELLSQLNGYGLELLNGGTKSKTTIERVAHFIAGALQRGEANELEACRALNIGRRTLQRELAASGTTFRQILQGERMRLARQYLIDSELSLTAISLLLGYSELSAFSRASRTWFSMSPSALRQTRRAPPKDREPTRTG